MHPSRFGLWGQPAWLRPVARSIVVFGLAGPVIGLVVLVLSAIAQGLFREHASLASLARMSVGWVILIPFAYLFGFWSALATGAVTSPLLVIRRPRLYALAATLLGAVVSCLLVPNPMNARGARLATTFADNAPWLIGAGAAAGLGSALLAVALTHRHERRHRSGNCGGSTNALG